MSKRTLSILSECIPIFTMLQDENRQQILMLLFAKAKTITNRNRTNRSSSTMIICHIISPLVFPHLFISFHFSFIITLNILCP